METTIPLFGPREFIALVIALAASIAFLLASVKLIFTKRSEKVVGSYDPNNAGFGFNTRNLAVVSLIISGILLAFIVNYALAKTEQQWVYLGPGFDEKAWNFENIDGSKKIVANDIVRALMNVNIRSAPFGNFTGTWLSILSPPEPSVIGIISPGKCATVLGFKSVGFNKVWMRIKRSACN